ncbi:rhodanese-like domain-containing protein [Arthrobacter sp. 31Y]|uniref:rhodanese-like domain-containing protein n=1 Tax=Arthrobacter sp. 31Y TaxID=1115632 RepID=UPI00214A8F21|nr:rhodanese-like domain-containing protein [Arthrobacter sp. 31Y]
MEVAESSPGSLVVVDTRRQSSWDHGHIPGAVHLPTAEIPALGREFVPAGAQVVVYSWGPGAHRLPEFIPPGGT